MWQPLGDAAIFSYVISVDVSTDGAIYLGGRFDGLSCDPAKTLNGIRLNRDGRIDPSWHVDVSPEVGGVRSVLATPDGHVLVGGEFETINDVVRPGFAIVDNTTDVIFKEEFGDWMCIP
jgi:hypothetical protein